MRSFWANGGLVAGFAEWPGGVRGPADFDSGPVVGRVGSTASAFGIAATTAIGDTPRLARLAGQLALGRRLVELQDGGAIDGVPIDARYVTGFLMGDATLFYSLTWRALPPLRSSAGSASAS